MVFFFLAHTKIFHEYKKEIKSLDKNVQPKTQMQNVPTVKKFPLNYVKAL